ncbi:MAG: DUF5606 domain-containing protein [Cyclobacteriaceae bacterium]|nr:DUF5606 domain-containing protein [Cyclobacteriaceae bacterium]
MEFKDLAAIAGKPGLYRIIKPTRASVIVETLDAKKSKLVVNASQRISVLDEISIYTNTAEGSEPLKNIFRTIYQEFGVDTDLEKDATNAELMSFFKSVLPEYDQDKVYPSDIKKVVRWYHLLLDHAPHLVKGSSDEEE